MKYQVLIADDEPLAREKLRHFFARETDFEVVGEATHGTEALALARQLKPDLLVLDIQMPPLDGLEVAHAFGEHAPVIVFTTAHREHAVEAFTANAADYLLKPYSLTRFGQALARARARLAAGSVTESAASAPGRAAPGRLLVKSRGRYIVVAIADVEWMEAAANYVVLHTSTGNHVLRGTMTDTLIDFGPGLFFRTGRSTAVNLQRIQQVLMDGPGEHTVVLQSGAKVTLQRSFRELQEKIEQLVRVPAEAGTPA